MFGRDNLAALGRRGDERAAGAVVGFVDDQQGADLAAVD